MGLSLSSFFLVWFSVAAAAEQPKLNVIMIDICSARADHFGAYGYSKPVTPGFDELARESVLFEHALAQSSWCLPNYASLFTGHVPEVHGQYVNAAGGMAEFEVPLAQRMKRAGYRTAAFSGGVYFLKVWGLDRGFDAYENLFSTSSALPASFSQLMPKAMDWIGREKGKPFFLYTAVDDLHAPYQSEDPELYDRGYEGVAHDSDTLNVRFFRAYNGEPLDFSDPLKGKLDLFRKDARHLAHLTAHYDAALNSVDRKVDEFIRRIKEAGLWENTVVILTADHGELLGEHGLLGHTESLYEPVTRVPLLVHYPGLGSAGGKRIKDLVERIDLTPTVLDIGGASYADGELQGRSLLGLLRGRNISPRTYAYASSKRNMASRSDLDIDERVVRDRRWKLHWYSYKGGYELYDMDNDPMELHDVSAKYPGEVNRLSFELLKHFETSRPHQPGLPSGKRPKAAGLDLEIGQDPH